MNNQIVRVEKGFYFSIPMVVIGVMILFGAFGILLSEFYHAWIFDSIYRKTADIIRDFFIYKFPIMVLLTIIGLYLILTKRFFEFNPETKEIREGKKFINWEFGKWQPFNPQCNRIAFQRYEQNSDYTYGGLYSKKVNEYVYDLRLVNADNTFTSLISASEFKTVSQIIILGKKISEVYNIPLHDYVIELLKKKKSE